MKPTTAQAATANQLKDQGFAVLEQDCKIIRMAKGNDYRTVQQDGTQKRAYGARG